MKDLVNSNPSIENNRTQSDTNLPDFGSSGYRVVEVLGRHLNDRRVTYLAIESATNRQVIIKKYQTPNGETDYLHYQPEIDRLQQLNYPNIPAYLDAFGVEGGFCVVRAYQQGQPLSKMGALPPADIKTIGDATLRIIAHLQRQNPAIVHHNIKSENIIVETDEETESLMVYLVDFGFSRHPELRLKQADATGGLSGFIPPERLIGKSPNNSADLYSLGITLISLLLGRASHLMHQTIDERGAIEFKSLLPATVHPRLTGWLEKMVDANPNKRFNNAVAARSAMAGIPAERRMPVSLQLASPQPIALWKIIAVGLGLLGLVGIGVRQVFFNEDNDLAISAKGQALQQQAQLAQNPVNRLLNDKSCIGCNLSGRDFSKAVLTSANLNQAKLNNTNFTSADLSAAIFQDADLSSANFTLANLREAGFYGAKLLGADLSGANLDSAKLVYAKATGGVFRKINLANADLKYAELQQVDFTGANLTAADLRNADLSYANLRGANLDGALLDGAKLTGATMADGKIYQDKIVTPVTMPSIDVPKTLPKVDGINIR
jgi:uncharacterized protein YjbI with pentapeptide repeats